MTFWIAPVDREEMTPEWEEVTTSHFNTAVTQALFRFGKADWTIAAHEKGAFDDWGPGEELAYHAEEYPDVLFVRTLGLRHLGAASRSGLAIEDLLIERAPEDAAAEWAGRDNHYPLRSTSVFRNCKYPGELVNYSHFNDTSYGNDVTASIQFSIGAEAFMVWIAPLRPFDRSTAIREQGAKAFQVAEFDAGESADQDVDDALENANEWASDISFETDSVAELNDYFARIWNAQAAGGRARAAAAGAQAASPERQLGLEAAKLSPYNGWSIVLEDPKEKLWEVRHPASDLYLQFVLDQPDNGTISWTMFDQADPDAGVDAGTVRLPRQGRTAEQLQAVLRPIMDRYQPAPEPEDATSKRFAMLDLDRGPRRTATAPDVDDTAERFKLLELNPKKSSGLPAGTKVYRLQRTVSRLERDIPAEGVSPGVVDSPEQLVGEVLAPFLDDRVTESYVAVFINVRNKVLGYLELTEGAVASVSVHPGGIFREALVVGAAAVITAHNHPSGDPTPSAEDEALWGRLRSAGDILGIPVVDNLVIGKNGTFYSESMKGTGRATVRRRSNPSHAYPKAGELQAEAISQITSNPLEVWSRDGGLEGVFAREEDAEYHADELRRIGAKDVAVKKRTRPLQHRKRNPAGRVVAREPWTDGTTIVIENHAYGYSAFLVSAKGGRVPISFGTDHVTTAAEALASAKKFLRSVYGRTNPSQFEEDCDTDILDGMARAIWVMAYANYVEELSKDERKAGGHPVNLSGITWDDQAPETPDSAVEAARDLYILMNRANGEKTVGQLYEQACFVDKIRPTTKLATTFGHYLAMQAMGEGVSWFDDHKTFPLKFPRGFEAHFDDGEVWWSPHVRSRENPRQRGYGA